MTYVAVHLWGTRTAVLGRGTGPPDAEFAGLRGGGHEVEEQHLRSGVFGHGNMGYVKLTGLFYALKPYDATTHSLTLTTPYTHKHTNTCK